MHIRIITPVNARFETVVSHFNEQLLRQVSPPFPPTRLLRYDGNLPGNEVHVELNFIFFRQVWKSKIIACQKSDQSLIFVDEGTQLPFFLAYWHHEHRVEKTGTDSTITDNITCRTPFLLTDWLMYPLMYLQFWYRKPLYRKYFKRLPAAGS